MLGGADEVVTKWNLETGQAARSIDEIYSKMQREARAEKKLDDVRAALDRTTQQLTDSTRRTSSILGGLASNMTSSITKGNLLASAIGSIKSGVRETLRDLDAYSAAWKQYSGDIDGARDATQGLLGDLELMQARNRLATLGVQLSDAEYNRFADSVTRLSEAAGKDLAESLDKMTEAVGRGNARMAQYLGIVVKATNADDKRRLILEQLHEKSAALAEDTDTLTDEINRMYVAIKNAVLWAGHWVNINVSLGDTLRGLLGAVGVGHIEKHIEGVARWREEDKRLNDELERTSDLLSSMRGVATPGTAMGGAGGLPTSVEGGILGMPFAYGDKPGVGGMVAKKKPTVAGKKKTINDMPSEWFTSPAVEAPEFPGQPPMSSAQDAKAYQQNWKDAAEEIWNVTRASREATQASLELSNSYAMTAETMENAFSQLRDLGVGALAELTAGMWDAAEAAINGSKSFGQAMGDMLQSVLMSIAKQATVLAAMEIAKGVAASLSVATAGKAAGHFYAAALFGGVATAAGVGGLGMAAAGFGSGGGATRDTSEVATVGSAGGRNFGRTAEGNTIIHVHIEMPSAKSGAALWMGDQILTTKVVRQAA